MADKKVPWCPPGHSVVEREIAMTPVRQMKKDQWTPGNLCDRCSSIDWYHLATTTEQLVVKIDESYDELLDSRCPVCYRIAYLKLEAAEGSCDLHVSPGFTAFGSVSDDDTSFCNVLRFDTAIRPSQLDPMIGLTVPNQMYDMGPCPIEQRRVNFDHIKQCLEHCQATHEACTKPGTTDEIDGFRVIDCRSERFDVIPAPQNCRYVALSYVWGGTPPEENAIPQTIKDSIQATLSLGFEYLWVDRFCIHQNDKDDKLLQISNMDKIYAKAVLTIVDAAGRDANSGLPGISRDGLRVGSLTLQNGVTFSPSPADLSAEIMGSVWASRGWTLQETFLASRRLVFTDYGVSYLCNTLQWLESLKKDTRVDYLRSSITPSLKSSRYSGSSYDATSSSSGDDMLASLMLLKDYSHRNLTYTSDTVNACFGILKAFQTTQLFFPWGLAMWRQTKGGMATLKLDWRRCENQRVQRLQEAPSWSSLGWKGGIDMPRPSLCSMKSSEVWFGDVKSRSLSLDEVANELMLGRIAINTVPRYLHVTGLLTKIPVTCKQSWPAWAGLNDEKSPIIINLRPGNTGSWEKQALLVKLDDDIFMSLEFNLDILPSLSNFIYGLPIPSIGLDTEELRDAFDLITNKDRHQLFFEENSLRGQRFFDAAEGMVTSRPMLLLEDRGGTFERIGIVSRPLMTEPKQAEYYNGAGHRLGIFGDDGRFIFWRRVPHYLRTMSIESLAIG
ncbi:heterokaryon incompatibility protein-domain-containing protein [Nemania abortiva]|nr:heterokaryon incompatibility protein-domain-containing protein [Nemania abortiva]